ncbi:IS66 family transposase, partial [Pseudomonas sp. TNT11]
MSLLLPRTRYLLCTLLLAGLSLNSATAAPTPGDQDLIRDRQNRLLDGYRGYVMTDDYAGYNALGGQAG